MARPLGNLPPLRPRVLVPAKASNTIPIANSTASQGTGRLNMEVVYIRQGEGRNDEWLVETKTRKSESVISTQVWRGGQDIKFILIIPGPRIHSWSSFFVPSLFL
ncbi:hypothetical protein TorRG33x02_316570 [Trema orientale]|uniref:Uncharacterized protein n=1 Tax=Trema orientale TaxID=63057 RepID=A0A2P5BLV0_TREOI|nr:hypothetical protein TorRG33x02_316570 [Trema orientale]